jgi:hypothetical protein
MPMVVVRENRARYVRAGPRRPRAEAERTWAEAGGEMVMGLAGPVVEGLG